MDVIFPKMKKSRQTEQSFVKRLAICLLVGFFGLVAAGTSARADSVTFLLDNVFLDDGSPMTGKFDWTYDTGDFEGGSGYFTELVVPYWDPADYASLNVIFDIRNSIEFNRDSIPSTHDQGYGINLKFSPALTPTGSAMVDSALSKFECCGNGFRDQGFRSGGLITSLGPPVPLPAALPLFAGALCLLRLHGRCRRRLAA